MDITEWFKTNCKFPLINYRKIVINIEVSILVINSPIL